METNQLYIAGLGLISAIGDTPITNWHAFKAGINRYFLSDYCSSNFKPIKLASIPENVFPDLPSSVDLGEQYSMRHTKILLAAHLAIKQALSQNDAVDFTSLPLFQSCSHLLPNDIDFNAKFRSNLMALNNQEQDPAVNGHYFKFNTGRTGVIDAIDLAFKAFDKQNIGFVLAGGADSFDDPQVLKIFDNNHRLNCEDSLGGFSPGEGAAYILLTNSKENAMRMNGKCIYVSRPSLNFEEGHIYSEAAYRGEGLAECFKQLLKNPKKSALINTIYSSMNGEQYWSKEFGVAMIRNSKFFTDDVRHEHPADCYGDLGAACAGALIVLAAFDLCTRKQEDCCLVYSSSDHGFRASIIVGTEFISK